MESDPLWTYAGVLHPDKGRIRGLMELRKWKPPRLAKEANLGRKTIENILNYNYGRPFEADTLRAVASALGADLRDLLTEDEQRRLDALIQLSAYPTGQKLPAAVAAESKAPASKSASGSDAPSGTNIFVPVGYSDKFYIYSAYYLPLLFDKQYIYGPTKYGAQAANVPAGDILSLALSDDPAIIPVGFDRWIKGEEYRNKTLSPRIRETQGADEARKVLYVPDFDGMLEPVYQDASFEWFNNRVSSAEEQQSFVERLLTEDFIKAIARSSQDIALPPELARLRPLRASVLDSEAWHGFARHFLTMYVGDRGIAAKFGAKTAQSMSEMSALYRLVDRHLDDAEVSLGEAFGDQLKRESDEDGGAIGRFDPIRFLNAVIEIPRPGGAIDILRIRERGDHRKFRKWIARFFAQRCWTMASVPAEEVVEEMIRELKIVSDAVRRRLLEAIRAAGISSRPFSALSSLVTHQDDSTALKIIRTHTLTSDLLRSQEVAAAKRELAFYSPEDFHLSLPLKLHH